jgi:hypothetical protein
MEKIKNVLHGHKKEDDLAHDSHTSSSTTEGYAIITCKYGCITDSRPVNNIQSTTRRMEKGSTMGTVQCQGSPTTTSRLPVEPHTRI